MLVFFCFLGCGKSMNGIKLLISNLKRKKGWEYSKQSLDFHDYLLTCLRFHPKILTLAIGIMAQDLY